MSSFITIVTDHICTRVLVNVWRRKNNNDKQVYDLFFLFLHYNKNIHLFSKVFKMANISIQICFFLISNKCRRISVLFRPKVKYESPAYNLSWRKKEKKKKKSQISDGGSLRDFLVRQRATERRRERTDLTFHPLPFSKYASKSPTSSGPPRWSSRWV